MTALDKINRYLKHGNVQTPLYVYDKSILKRQYDRLQDNKPSNLEIFYAMKGNSNIHILRFFRERGLGTEIASGSF